MSRRVVITGLGGITPIGNDLDTIWTSLREGRSAVRPLNRFDASQFSARLAAQVDDFDPLQYLPPHRLKRLDRFAQFAVVSGILALRDAGLDAEKLAKEMPSRVGIICGTALGGISAAEDAHARFLQKGVDAIPAALALQVFGGSAHSQVAIELGFTGYGITNACSCAAGTVAVGEALRVLRDGWCDVVLAMAAEAPLNPLTFGAFDVIHTMSPDACLAFDRRRNGFVMAEAGACLVLETLESAQARGAHIYAEVLGYCLNNDAYHMTSTRPDLVTIVDCMSQAIQRAGITPSDIEFVHAHGSGTKMNDSSETAAMKLLFGADAKRLKILGSKPYHGHPLGAAGAVELLISCLALKHGWIPPTLNLQEPDPDCDLDYIAPGGCDLRPRYVLKNSFGFGGINSCLVLGNAGQ